MEFFFYNFLSTCISQAVIQSKISLFYLQKKMEYDKDKQIDTIFCNELEKRKHNALFAIISYGFVLFYLRHPGPY